MKSSTKGIIGVAAFLLVVFALVLILSTTLNKPNEMKYNDFQKSVEAGTVVSVNINDDKAKVKLTSNKTYVVYVRDTVILEFLEDKDPTHKIEVGLNDRYKTNVWSYIYPVLIGVALIVVVMLIIRNMGEGRQAGHIVRSGANAQNGVKVRFADVAGAEEEKEELQEIVEFLKHPQKFVAAGARIPAGVLLVGPPGTGKTLFAKAVAGEASVPFFSISGSDFVELYVGVGASRVRNLFEQAKRNKPCIIFIDEIDAVGRQRGAGLGGGHDEREQTLNQLLVQMDGFSTVPEIIVMAATNRADILDNALLRPGRFDRQIHIRLPDVRGREAIFRVHSRNKTISQDVDFQTLARITSGFSGADIENLLNEAAILAARDNRTAITMIDINEGINKITFGPQKKSRLVTEVDKRISAYHEAGHAIVAHQVPNFYPVHEVSIIPRGVAGGYTSMRPDNDNNLDSLSELHSSIVVSMGGRAAEKIVIKDITTGASGDIRTATAIARKMVTEFGMSDLGPIYYGADHEVFLGRDYGSSHAYSEELAAKIDREVERLINESMERAVEIITKNRDKMDVMVRVLTEAETIYTDEVNMIMEGKSAQEVMEFIKSKRK